MINIRVRLTALAAVVATSTAVLSMSLGMPVAQAAVKTAGSLSESPSMARAGDEIRLTGRARPFVRHQVRLQRKRGTSWVTLTSATTTRTGAFAFHTTVPGSVATQAAYRVRSPRTARSTAFVTPTRWVKIMDTTAPQVTAEVSGEQDADGAYVESATVRLTSIDSRSGVATVEYSLDGAAFAGYTDPVVVTQPGHHSVQYRATDNAGNTSAVGSVALTVVESPPVDTTAPQVNASVAGDKDTDGAYVGSATVTLSASDTESGVAEVEYALDGQPFTAYSGPVTVNEPGQHTVDYRATDNTGNTSQVQSAAFTVAEPAPVVTRAPCALCILGDLRPTAHNVQNADITASGGNIHFNGDVSISSGGRLRVESARAVTIQGQLINSGATVTGTLLQNQPRMADPLASLPMPDPTSVPAKAGANPCDPVSGGPGRYGSHTFYGTGCVLDPGLYVIAGGSGTSWTSSGNLTISGAGVTLYFTCGTPSAPAACAPGATGATLDASGSGIWKLKAPASGPQQGQLLVLDRNSTAEMKLRGDSGENLSGTIYAASGRLAVNGASCMSPIDSLIVTHSIRFSGNPACLTSTYNDASNAPIPPASDAY